MLVGEYIVKMDDKGRIPFPARLLQQVSTMYKDQQSIEFVMLAGRDKCVDIYPLPVWMELQRSLKAKLDISSDLHRKFLRRLLRHSAVASLDSSNRLLVPQPLREYAKLNGEVVLITLIDHIEMWNPQLLNGQVMEDRDFEFVYKQLFSKKNNR